MGIRDVFGDDLSGVHVFTDFDGTLSPIVDNPEEALPAPGVASALARLRSDGAAVSVISGRPVSFLGAHLDDTELELVGLYGLEVSRGGHRSRHPDTEPWIPAVTSAVQSAGEAFGVEQVESKLVSLTVHYRGRAELAGAMWAWADDIAKRTGLVARGAKQSVELHPPIEIDKGTAVLERVGSATGVVMIGDDVGDLPAFEALDTLAQGVRTLKVVVASAELDAQVASIADLTFDSPAEVVAFLAE